MQHLSDKEKSDLYEQSLTFLICIDPEDSV